MARARGRRRGRGRDPSEEPEEVEEVQQVEEIEEDGHVEEENQEEEHETHEAQGVGSGSNDEGAPPGEVVGLQFDEELTWRPGKAIPVTTLLDRLQRLSQELHGMEQDHVDLESLTDVSDALGQRNLLAHKNEGVRAFAASCIVDILQLSAPDAPFTQDQLKMFFTLVVSHVFPSLANQSHPYHTEHKYVLRSLSEVQSIVLVNDVDGADDLLLRLFSTFFDAVSGPGPEDGVSKDVSTLMADTLTTLIDEASGISPKVIEVIMAQFLRAAPPGGPHSRSERGDQNGGQSTLLLKSEPPAYVMAKDICNQCSEKMVHYVSQYFSDVIIDASRFAAKSNGHGGGDEDEEGGPRGPTDAELKELRKAHLLIRELWRAAPSVLQNVIPQVEAELSADNIELRQIATETLGDMISGIGAAGPPPTPDLDPAVYPPLRLADDDATQTTSVLTTPLSPQPFAQTHSSAYHSFIGRSKDRTAAIRAAWTTSVGRILSTSAGGIGLGREEQAELVRALSDKLNDNDERVRLAAVKAMELFGFRDFVTKLGPTGGVEKEGSILSRLADRCRDKRPAVRVDAMTLLGSLWAVGAGELAARQELVLSALAGIPSVIFKAWYANDLELNVLIDRVIFESLIPLAYPPIKSKSSKSASQSQSGAGGAPDGDRIRTERILLLVQQLDAQAKKAFFVMQARQSQFATVLEAFIKHCEGYNGGVMDDNGAKKTAALEKTIQYIGQFFPDPMKVRTDYQKFAKANDRRNYQLIRFAIASDSDFKTVRGAIKELVKRMQGTPAAGALDTLIPFLYRSASLIFNKSHLSTILDYSKTDQDGFGAVAHEILHEISVRNPDMFKNFVGDLCKDLVQQAPSEHKQNDPTVVDILRATSAFAKKYPQEIPDNKEFVRALNSYALYGQPVKAAKYAIKILLAQGSGSSSSSSSNKSNQGQVLATTLFDKIMKRFVYDAPFFLNKLQCISQLYLQAPTVAREADGEILGLTVQKLLREVRTEASESKDPDWVDDSDIDDELRAKCLSLRLAVNRLRSSEVDVAEEAKTQAAPVFKLLMNFVIKDGEVCQTRDTPKHHRARLRLLAAELVLKLCTVKHYDDAFSHKDFHLLALVTQDREPNVRRGFVEKLMKYLVHNRLRHRFYTMIFLTAFEPMADFRQHVETWIRSRMLAMQERGGGSGVSDKNNMEALLGRLIPLLAHHPDYSPETDDLADHARYLLFFISNVATEENLGLISRYAERVKQTRDALNPDASENLYVVSDLAQAVMRKWQDRKAWSFQAYPGKVGLPIGLFSPLPNHEAAQEIAMKQYIPDGVEEKLDGLMRAMDKKKRKSADERAEGGPAAKKARTREPKPAATGSVKKKTTTTASSKLKKLAASSTTSTLAKKTKTKAKAKPRRDESPLSPSYASRSSAVLDKADRRRSGRSRKSASSAYIDRDDSEDEREMMEGVASWKYENRKRGGDDDNDDDDGDDEEEEEEEAEGEDESDAEPMDEDGKGDEEGQEEEVPPAKSKSRKSAQQQNAKVAVAKKSRTARGKAADDDGEELSSALSEPDAQAVGDDESAEEGGEEGGDEEGEEEEEEDDPAPTRSNGRGGSRRAAAASISSKNTQQLPSRPAAAAAKKGDKKKKGAAAPAAAAAASRPRRGNRRAAAKDADEMDVDSD